MRKAGLLASFIVVVFFCASCEHKDDHLSPEEMAPILADLHVADAYSGMIRDSLGRSAGKNYDSLALWTKGILAKYHITQNEFNQSMDWYRDRPVALDSLYARVVPLLEHNRK